MTLSRRLHAGALALVLAGGCGALGLRALDGADPVTVDDAVKRFRGTKQTIAPTAGTTPAPSATATTTTARASAAPPGRGAPTATPTRAAAPSAEPGIGMAPEGVYVYATTGYETGGSGPAHSRHDYPAQTTMTMRRDGCGSSMRWDPIEDRWDDVLTCTTGDTTSIRVYDTMHTFFGVSERHRYECSGTSWFRPPSTTPGYRWTFDCDSGQAQTHTEARIVGIERVSAGDGIVDALHVRFDTSMTGATEGSNPSDYWLALHEPFLVRKTGRVDAKVHTDFGTLDYHEEYDVRLTSRRPRT